MTTKHATPEMAYPLRWPEHEPRTERFKRIRAPFRLTLAATAKNVMDELVRLGARYSVISSNIRPRLDNLPYGQEPEPTDPGIAVYFSIEDKPHVIACDRWQRTRDNIHAIGLSIEALRGLKRWGSTDLMNRAFAGFHRELPPASSAPPPPNWREIFNAPEGEITPAFRVIIFDHVRRRFKELALAAHPDHGGNADDMIRLNQAFEAARAELRQE